MRGGVNGLERHAGLGGGGAARLVLRRGLHQLTVQAAKLDPHLAKRCLDGDIFAAEFAAVGGVAADAQRGGFAQDHFAKPIRIRLSAKHGEQHSGAVLFHLDRRVKYVQRAGLQCRPDEMAKVLSIEIVEVSQKKIGTKIHDTPVIADTELPPPDGSPLIIAGGAAGARELIEADVAKKGYVPGIDAWFVC